jgi:glycerol-3-phosphate acyltransferase PlsY
MQPDNNAIIPWVAAIVVMAYLIGSFSSAYIIGRLWTRVDLRREGDGHISATACFAQLKCVCPGLKSYCKENTIALQ